MYERMLSRLSKDLIVILQNSKKETDVQQMAEKKTSMAIEDRRLGIAERAEAQISANEAQIASVPPPFPSSCLPPLGPRKVNVPEDRNNFHLVADSDDSSHNSMVSSARVDSAKGQDRGPVYVINHHYH